MQSHFSFESRCKGYKWLSFSMWFFLPDFPEECRQPVAVWKDSLCFAEQYFIQISPLLYVTFCVQSKTDFHFSVFSVIAFDLFYFDYIWSVCFRIILVLIVQWNSNRPLNVSFMIIRLVCIGDKCVMYVCRGCMRGTLSFRCFTPPRQSTCLIWFGSLSGLICILSN